MLIYTAVIALIFAAGYAVSRFVIWQSGEGIYSFLKLAEYVFAPLVLLAGYAYIVYFFFFRKKTEKHGSEAIKSLSKRTVRGFLLSLAVFAAAFILAITFSQYIFLSLFWRDETVRDIIYDIIFYIFFPAAFIGGIVFITKKAFGKPFSYLSDIVSAAEQMQEEPEKPISMPDSIKSIQDELNIIRENANRSAALAKENEQKKNDLIVYLAHDLKTPLTSVIGYTELLRDTPELPEDIREKYLDIAYRKSLRLEELINEFFEITRFNLTENELIREKVNLSVMTEQVISEFMPIFRDNRLSCDRDIEKDIFISCDVGKTERVLDNLIRNAVSYSYPDSTVYIKLFSSEDKAVMTFENSGKTIPKEKLSRIFEQFFRADSSRGSSSGGSGLGLSVAKQIVELHSGEIFAESEDEKIKITVRLPKL